MFNKGALMKKKKLIIITSILVIIILVGLITSYIDGGRVSTGHEQNTQ